MSGSKDMKRGKPALVVDDIRFDAHGSAEPHPERPERLEACRRGLRSAIPDAQRIELPAPPIDPSEAEAVHAPAYVEQLRELLAQKVHGHLDPDTYVSPGSEEATWLAAGGALALAQGLMEGKAQTGLALLRPPGHHARRAGGMGFCLINNIAVATERMLRDGMAERVAIVDWDVHHGNGTEDIFYDDSRVLFVSVHQSPLYPGTGRYDDVGEGAGRGRNVNLPLPSGSGPPIYEEAFRRLVLPLLSEFAPDLILVSAGFDAHERDPLAGLHLDSETYGAMAHALVQQAEQLGHGRVGFVLEGGYDLIALEQSMAAVARSATGQPAEFPQGRCRPEERNALEATLDALTPFWPRLRLT